MITVKCIECGKDFEAQRTSAKFCSPNCRVKWNNNPENKKTNTEAEEEETAPKTKLSVAASGSIKEEPSDEEKQKMKDFVQKIDKDFGEGSVMWLGDSQMKNIDAISTGSIGLNAALGIGGLPKGRIVEIFGPESSGKTTLSLHIIAEAQKEGMQCLFIDAEHAFDPDYATAIGVNMKKITVSQPDYGEQGLEIADRGILSGDFGVVIIDSVAALTPKAEIEGEMGDSKMGVHPRLMGQACRKLVASVSKTNTLCIFINQIRQTIGNIYGPQEFTPGGNALKFFSSVRIDIRCSALLKDGEEVIGRRSKAKVVKSKIAPPFKHCEFDIIYGQGISKSGELIDIGVEKGIIQKSGSWYAHGSDKLGQGRDSVKALIEANETFAQQIEAEIKEKLK